MSGRDEEGRPKPGARAARDRLAAVAFVASLLGHRTRNQLATIRAALELLHAGMEANMPPEYRATLLQEMDALVGDFNLGLDMIRCGYGPLEPIPAREAIEGVIADFEPLAARAGARLEARFDPAARTLLGDTRLLRVVLLNLMRNSLQALEGAAAPAIAVRTESAEGRCAVEVEDNGPGVPAALRGRIFIEPVASRGGAGLGLILCRDAMTVMGGTIRHEALSGAVGARFRLEFASGSAVL